MKKYVKPDISFQKFNLTTNISAGCVLTATSNEGNCPVHIPEYPELVVFNDYPCTVTTPDMKDTICYHVPSADTNVFES